jgi:hypothetical protein
MLLLLPNLILRTAGELRGLPELGRLRLWGLPLVDHAEPIAQVAPSEAAVGAGSVEPLRGVSAEQERFGVSPESHDVLLRRSSRR